MSMSGDDLRYLMKVRADVSRAMADSRFPPPNRFGGDLRMFVVTAVWVLGVERVPRGSRIQRVCEVMHLDSFRFWELVRSDLPRYEPESLHGDGGCRGWLPRARRRCGKGATTAFRVTSPVDGTWELAGYCSAHRGEAEAAQAAERRRRQAGLPEPLPNRGGLLPCYLPWDWEKNYRKASGSWEPPAVGIRADDWPTLAKVAKATAPAPPKLTVMAGGREADGPTIGEADDSGPALRLVGRQPTTP